MGDCEGAAATQPESTCAPSPQHGPGARLCNGSLHNYPGAHLSLYGSVARDQADEQSDVDVIVDTSDGQAPGLFLLARITDELERILGRPVDVISRRGLDHAKALKRRVAIGLVDVF